MTTSQNIIYLGLGTNLGDRQENLLTAVDLLSPKVSVLAQSPIYQTPPWGYTDQADFLNQVIKAETKLRPTALLRYLKKIEKRVGRTATFRWGPREIDIDILFYADRVIKRKKLTIPHPRVHQRAFMLVPLADLSPELHHPVSGKTIAQLLTEVDCTEINEFTAK
jgi:2-amino-4-hydroxy-6-hydroxymethyldihydropteridine diphosphokinase